MVSIFFHVMLTIPLIICMMLSKPPLIFFPKTNFIHPPARVSSSFISKKNSDPSLYLPQKPSSFIHYLYSSFMSRIHPSKTTAVPFHERHLHTFSLTPPTWKNHSPAWREPAIIRMLLSHLTKNILHPQGHRFPTPLSPCFLMPNKNNNKNSKKESKNPWSRNHSRHSKSTFISLKFQEVVKSQIKKYQYIDKMYNT